MPCPASFVGFTGTPIDRQDASTRAVFGDYISICDIQRSVEDGATVPIYYESRPAKLGLSEDELAFYVQVLGDETPRAIAHQLVETVRSNVTIDWTLRENVRANLRRRTSRRRRRRPSWSRRRSCRRAGWPPETPRTAPGS